MPSGWDGVVIAGVAPLQADVADAAEATIDVVPTHEFKQARRRWLKSLACLGHRCTSGRSSCSATTHPPPSNTSKTPRQALIDHRGRQAKRFACRTTCGFVKTRASQCHATSAYRRRREDLSPDAQVLDREPCRAASFACGPKPTACAPALLTAWQLAAPQATLLFRIAVRETEAWVLADRRVFSDFAGTPVSKVPPFP